MICTVVGARPNFIKMGPVIQELQKRNIPQLFVHTGQHYDQNMSTIFFDELKMPQPDIYMGIGSGSHADQTARIMVSFEKICQEHKIQLVIVAGDVNSTLACALVAAKMSIPVAHIESGLRSFDRSMPEEINRVVTDHISDLLFTTEPSANDNLSHEGIHSTLIHYVGNSMIDSLKTHLNQALSLSPWQHYGFTPSNYGLVTLHRPSNVDHMDVLQEIAYALDEIGQTIPLLFPMHPRTFARGRDIWENTQNVRIVEPLGYLEFLGLMSRACVVITDSGGIQEETTALGVPCVTVRDNTERPITLTQGTNQLVPAKHLIIVDAVLNIHSKPNIQIPDFWDGQAAIRIVDVVQKWWQDVNTA